jgi:hypothetical protein
MFRKMGETLQHQTITQCSGSPPTGPRNHRPDGPKARHAITIKLDHLGGADQQPGDLERQIGAFVGYYNTQRYNESLGNVTPPDVYFGRDKAIIREMEKIKKLTIQNRRLQHQKQAA